MKNEKRKQVGRNGDFFMVISINVKSGTGGYSDYDGCDLCIKEIESENFPIPRIGESLDIMEDNDRKRTNDKGKILQEFHTYLVTDVRYWLCDDDYGVTIYVIPIGRSVE